METRPNKIAALILKQLLPDHIGHNGLGDYEELFHEMVEERGAFLAHFWYWCQIFKSFPRSIKENIFWSTNMFQNYFKIAFRNLKKNPGFSLVNITGLAAGLTLFIFIFSVVQFYFNFDTFHADGEKIHSIIEVNSNGNDDEFHSAIIPVNLEIPLIDEFSGISDLTKWMIVPNQVVKFGEKIFYEGNGIYADKNFFSFFTFNLIEGNKTNVLSQPNSIVLTKKTAEKYFGSESPMGKSLIIGGENYYKVTGVCEDIPLQSSISFSFLISSNSIDISGNPDLKGVIYIKAEVDYVNEIINEKFPGFIKKHYAEEPASPNRFYAFPLVDQFIYTESVDAYWFRSEPTLYYVLLGLGIALLVVLSINFMNLSTARYMLRSKEIGMRKVVGARKNQLRNQYIGESVLTTLLSYPVALILFRFVEIGFLYLFEGSPWAESNYSIFESPELLIFIFLITIALGIFSGSYPAFFLSKMDPISALKSLSTKGKRGGRTRKILVVSQFSFSVALIIFAIVSTNHFEFVADLDLGYSRDKVLTVPFKSSNSEPDKLLPLKNKLLEHPSITAVTSAESIPPFWYSKANVLPEGVEEENKWLINTYGIDYDFIEALEMEIVKGRSFSKTFSDENSILINEHCAGKLGWSDPIGKKIKLEEKEATVVGVVKDFHFKNIHFKISPGIMYLEKDDPGYLLIKYSGTDLKVVSEYIRETWKTIQPNEPFEYSSLEEAFNETYKSFHILSTLMIVISLIAIIFSSLGILGLASYSVQYKIKEIGVRKVLGASVSTIMGSLIWEFLRLVVISNLIACPLAYYLVRKFFEFGWSYPSEIGATVFIFTILVSLVTTVAVVFFQTLKAATSNPTDSLRCE